MAMVSIHGPTGEVYEGSMAGWQRGTGQGRNKYASGKYLRWGNGWDDKINGHGVMKTY